MYLLNNIGKGVNLASATSAMALIDFLHCPKSQAQIRYQYLPPDYHMSWYSSPCPIRHWQSLIQIDAPISFSSSSTGTAPCYRVIIQLCSSGPILSFTKLALILISFSQRCGSGGAIMKRRNWMKSCFFVTYSARALCSLPTPYYTSIPSLNSCSINPLEF